MSVTHDVLEQPVTARELFRTVPYMLIAFILTAATVAPFLAVLGYEVFYMHRVHNGVSVGGIELGGATLPEARQELSREFENYSERDIVFRYGERLWFVSAQELGVRYDAPLTAEKAFRVGREGSVLDRLEAQIDAFLYGHPISAVQSFDEGVAAVYLSRLSREINRPTRDARLVVDGLMVIEQPGEIGRELDITATLEALKVVLQDLADVPVDLVVREVPPMTYDMSRARVQVENIISSPLIFTMTERAVVSRTLSSQIVEKRWALERAALADMLVERQVKQPDGRIVLEMGLDNGKLRSHLEALAKQINRPARDARLAFDPATGQVTPLSPSQEGYRLDIEAALALVNEKVITPDHEIPLPVEVERPAVDVEDVERMGIKELLVEATTHFKGSTAARMRNIEVAAARFDGVVIPPGAVFLFNEYLGDVSAAAGYEESMIIWGDRTAVGIGGGVCQVSTTAFRAAFWAGLPILERRNHGYRVSWYEPPVGMDATVYAPNVDFKFKNDMASYILITTEVNLQEGTITFRFYGTGDGRVVEMVGPTETNHVPHGPAVYEDDPTLPQGTVKQVEWPRDGVDVTVERVVRRGNEVVLQDRFFSRYSPWPAVYLRGTAGNAAPEQPVQ